ncbi:hypothetical protein E2C01_082287 [Portunus trituberculatus]|uniref:Uncharacterized protein n=1 Tax=Portunus trituberculatus TaxID=210409 RepID=A0A5B7J4H6_PORTR|nr:hypothetical protein [Portunus trituberculatus]
MLRVAWAGEDLPVCVEVSKKAQEVSTVMVARVPSVICAEESRLPRDLDISSLWVLWRRKFLARMMSSVVDCLLKPRDSRISSVVDWRRNPRSLGECSLQYWSHGVSIISFSSAGR